MTATTRSQPQWRCKEKGKGLARLTKLRRDEQTKGGGVDEAMVTQGNELASGVVCFVL